VAWTVSGDTITGLVTQSLPNSNSLLNSAYAGTFDLQVEAVPLPGTVWLMLTGAAALAGRARFRRSA
jgi:hypothetical protein